MMNDINEVFYSSVPPTSWSLQATPENKKLSKGHIFLIILKDMGNLFYRLRFQMNLSNNPCTNFKHKIHRNQTAQISYMLMINSLLNHSQIINTIIINTRAIKIINIVKEDQYQRRIHICLWLIQKTYNYIIYLRLDEILEPQ